LKFQLLPAADVRRQFPALRPAEEMVAVWEPRAGILFPERCIEAHLVLAREQDAELRYDEPVSRWEPSESGIRVRSARGEYNAGQLLLTSGSWVKSLLPGLSLPFSVERQVQFWFEPKNPAAFQPTHCPIHIWEYEPGKHFYGFPDLGEGVKVAGHHAGEITNPDTIDRSVAPAEIEAMRSVVRRFLPDADGPLRSSVVCMYTNTPDNHFFLDRHPECPQVLIASPCSGHGFKFSSVIGEVLADLIARGESRFDLSLFRNRSC